MPTFCGGAVRLAGQAHDAAHRLDEAIVPRTRRVGAGLAETGDRAVDQRREAILQLAIAEPVFGESADLEIFDEDVALRDQVQRDRLPLGLSDTEGYRALVAIGADEIGALLGAGHVGRRKAAGVV